MSGNLDYLSDCLVCFCHAVKLVNFVETCILCTKIVITFERSKKNKNSRTLFFPDYQATLSPTVYYLFTFIKNVKNLPETNSKCMKLAITPWQKTYYWRQRGRVVCSSRVQILFWLQDDVVLTSPKFNFSATLINLIANWSAPCPYKN